MNITHTFCNLSMLTAGFLGGVITCILISRSVMPEVGPYHVINNSGITYTTKHYSFCNDKIRHGDAKFIVGPSSSGYKVMLSKEVSNDERRDILDQIREDLMRAMQKDMKSDDSHY